MGPEPGELEPEQLEMLGVLAGQTMTLMEMRIQQIELTQTRRRLENAQRIAKIGSWDYSVESERLTWSGETARIFGFESKALEHSRADFLARVHPDDRPIIETLHKRLLKEGGDFDYTHRIVCPKGEVRIVHEQGEAVKSNKGEVISLVGTVHDITERIQSQQQIAEQAALLDQTNDAVILRSMDHKIRFWNRGAEKIYGWSKDEALGTSIESLLYDDSSPFFSATEEVIEKGEWTGELQHRTKSGKRLTIRGRWTLIRNELGQPKSILAINTNVSEQKKLEMQFMRAQRMESIGTLAGGIAHDLNNLLAPILMGVDLLKRSQKNDSNSEILDNIELSAKRGAELVRQVLSFARGAEGAKIEVSPHHIIKEVGNIATNTFPKAIQTETLIAPNIWPILSNPTQLHQVILNLCLNARDAMPDGGELTISAENIQLAEGAVSLYDHVRPGPFVKIEVSDNGCGMPSDIVERVFEPFFTTKELSKGTGLGLSTVLGIVHGHGGFVSVYSEVGKGSTFKVYLPAAIEPDNSPSPAEEVKQLPRGAQQTVLIVDDESSILEVTRQMLEAFNYRVITAEDGAQAIGLFAVHANKIDVVITDMMMPIMDGAALIKAIKGIAPTLPIIATSGLAVNGTSAKASNLGVKEFLQKPYSADSLLKTLSKVLKN
ncbi:MAG: PAS domain-containing protein [Opitutales bacterium]|nr:PAS domain-containing protein [Opitutales bacterium]